MIDLKLLRENPDVVRASQVTRGEDPSLVDQLLAADEKRRLAIQKADEVRSQQKSLGKQIGQASPEERPALLEGAEELKAKVKEAEEVRSAAESTVEELQYKIDNVVEGAPAGGEDDFVLVEEIGEIPHFDFEPKDHLELGESLGLIDVKRGAKVSGARFYYLTGDGAFLQLGMLMLAAQKAREAGFQLMIPPVLVRPEIMSGTGFLGQHSDEVYYLPADDHYLVGTSEVALAGYHKDEIIDLSNGPLQYAGWSSCFRREAGSHGKDTRGILRVHQFDKLEMFVYCKPEDAEDMHRKLLDMEKEMLAAMELPYRTIDIAGGDLGSSAARKFDNEAWVPTQGRYRELTSTSNCTTFQARRLSIRYRDENGKTQVAATLNGTLATTRWIVAILENHQQADGSVIVPKALRPFVGKDVLTPQ
ncbi:serine--tRNA ligase [Corynebacterium macginleyi]|uniref:serine--tRNA ligase n=1 Tax=Corynebacterium macginleyi TaxID=38290 RepID=UPI00190D047B|nr:serine--tRNA ligase [Corynebacterium macginleyi]MBK4142417.1 serine--tRNA ligase [Corynebacterium macginleyi]